MAGEEQVEAAVSAAVSDNVEVLRVRPGCRHGARRRRKALECCKWCFKVELFFGKSVDL